MDNQNKDRSSESAGASGVAAVIVVGIFVACVIFLFAKGLFSSNSAKVPSGLDTATINTDEPDNTEYISESTSQIEISDSNTDSVMSISGTDSTVQTVDSQAEEPSLGVMYITEYAYLHTAPANEAENIICMSPGIEVTVLGYEDNGYVKITFQNIDGPLTGYIYGDYLSEYQTVVPSWQQ